MNCNHLAELYKYTAALIDYYQKPASPKETREERYYHSLPWSSHYETDHDCRACVTIQEHMRSLFGPMEYGDCSCHNLMTTGIDGLDFSTFFKQEIQRHKAEFTAELSVLIDNEIARTSKKETLPAEFHEDYETLFERAAKKVSSYDDVVRDFTYWQGAVPEYPFNLYLAKLVLAYISNL